MAKLTWQSERGRGGEGQRGSVLQTAEAVVFEELQKDGRLKTEAALCNRNMENILAFRDALFVSFHITYSPFRYIVCLLFREKMVL